MATPDPDGPGQPGSQLAETSPFLAAQTAATGSAAAEGPAFELRGLMSVSNETACCVYDLKTKTSAWVGLGEAGHPFVITWVDPARDEACLVTGDGRKLLLTLRAARVAAAGGPPAAGSMAAVANAAPGPISAKFSSAARSQLSPEAQAALEREDQAEQERRNARVAGLRRQFANRPSP
jgi:hypothetical protein